MSKCPITHYEADCHQGTYGMVHAPGCPHHYRERQREPDSDRTLGTAPVVPTLLRQDYEQA